MAYSMTGYGRYETTWRGAHLTLEIKSVNHRFCEVMIRSPRHLLFLEETLKRHIQAQIHRGRVEVFITLHTDALVKKRIQVDWELAEAFIQTAQHLNERFDLSGPLTVQDILNREELFHVEEELDVSSEALGDLLFEGIDQAIQQLKDMRRQEGLMLIEDLQQRLKEIRACLDQLKEQAPRVNQAFAQRLETKLRDFLEHRLDLPVEIDESRLLTEIALFAEKADINEELIRLASHLIQFEQIVNVQDEPLGRKLDFLVQEMNREVNTIGSKVNDSEIRQMVVELKSQLEKIKEQVQNLE